MRWRERGADGALSPTRSAQAGEVLMRPARLVDASALVAVSVTGAPKAVDAQTNSAHLNCVGFRFDVTGASFPRKTGPSTPLSTLFQQLP